MKEFELIEKFFASSPKIRSDVVLGIGDDAALIEVPTGKLLVTSTDSLVEGTHFFKGDEAHAIGYKSLAVNLSDFAAMGAMPCWVSLAITLPSADEKWLAEFMRGFLTLFDEFNLQLIGGDTTRGHLSITVQLLGVADRLNVLRRDAAKPNDLIYVTGTLGDAAVALEALQQNKQPLETFLNKLYYPTPRVIEGLSVAGIANAAIDISDGLLADVNHVLTQSQVGAVLFPDKLPLSESMQHQVPLEKATQFALSGGEDYELCLTVSPEKEAEVCAALEKAKCRYTCIGYIRAEEGLYLQTSAGLEPAHISGYQHF